MIINALFSYGLAAAAVAAAYFGAAYFLKRTGRRVHAGFLISGILAFFAAVFGLYMLIAFAFSESSTAYMGELMPKSVYMISVVVIFFILLGLLRYFILNAALFDRDRERQGVSFLAGFGLAGGTAAAIYCLFMFAYIAFTAATSRFTGITPDGALNFENNETISVITPLYSHVFFILALICYAVLMLEAARFMEKHARYPFSAAKTFGIYLLLTVCESTMACVLIFSRATIAVFVICAVVCAVFAAAVELLYRYRKEQAYDRQFE